jgi:hypothetical protein
MRITVMANLTAVVNETTSGYFGYELLIRSFQNISFRPFERFFDTIGFRVEVVLLLLMVLGTRQPIDVPHRIYH